MGLFCFLEKNEKTCEIINKYIEDEEKGIDLLTEDYHIQLEEMIQHQKSTGENGCDWSDKYADGERLYLNMLKEASAMLRFFEEFQKRLKQRGMEGKFSVKNMTKQDIADCCDILNTMLKEKYLDRIYQMKG